MSQTEIAKPFAAFLTTIPFSSYVFKDGNKIQFEGHRMILRKQEYIDEMRAEAEDARNIYITEDTNATEENTQDPMAALRAKIIADYEASKLAGVTEAKHDAAEETKPTLQGIVTSNEVATDKVVEAPKIVPGIAANK